MKRASLKTAKVPVAQSPTARDVTDRLLGADGSTLPKSKPARAPARKPRAPTGTNHSTLQPQSEPLPYVPYRPVPEQPPAPPPGPAPKPPEAPALAEAAGPIADAVEKTRAAVDALREAGRLAPARYDLAVRYRLDALAHHFEQVAQFLAGRAGS